MKNLKDKIISIFAGIGIMSLLMGAYSEQSQRVNYGTPESHEWEMIIRDDASVAYLLNKKTGEVRKYDANSSRYIIPKLD
tara:strand:+ start:712 stop:951 length:240 start_codon:yes stop_codon:yes gene_type:complete